MAVRLTNAGSTLSDSPDRLRGFVSAWLQVAQLRRPTAMRVVHRWAFYLIFVSVTFVLTMSGFAQVSKEYQLKAVFLWRLAQFTQWPSGAFEGPDSPIVICVLGENPFGEALDMTVRGETAHGRKFAVQQHRAIDQIKGCHILYITSSGTRQAKEISAAVTGRSVLTVRDSNGLPSSYEPIVRFITEQNRIKLRINLSVATSARLVFDPRLLRAAEIVE